MEFVVSELQTINPEQDAGNINCVTDAEVNDGVTTVPLSENVFILIPMFNDVPQSYSASLRGYLTFLAMLPIVLPSAVSP